MAGKDAAIDVGLRGLRQRVVGVAAGETRGDAGSTEIGVEAGLLAETGGRGRIGRRRQDAVDVVGCLALLLGGEILEIGARDRVQLEWEGVGGQACCGAVAEFAEDRVVRAGARAVSAGVGGRDLVVGVDLLGGFDVGADRRASVVEARRRLRSGLVTQAASTRSRRCCSDEPGGAVEFAAFLVCGEGEEEVAMGLIALAVQAQERGHKGGVGVLHVLRAAAVEVAALFQRAARDRCAGRRRRRLDHVHMARGANRLLRRRLGGGVQADDQVLLAAIRAPAGGRLRARSRRRESASPWPRSRW